MSTWLNVTAKCPCAICGKGDYCSRSADDQWGVCRRQGGPDAIERQDKNGAAYYLHRLGDALPRYQAPALPAAPQIARADAVTLNQVYHRLLAMLLLETRHRQALRARGLSDTDILRRGYRSLPGPGRARIASMLVEQFGPALCATVPGIVQRPGNRSAYSTLSGSPGLLIPVRTQDSAIVGLVVRVDDPGDGGKYRWLSSRYHDGPGPLVACHAPMFAGDTRTVRLTEGALKADVATALSGVLTLGLPGVAPWRLAIPVLSRIKPATILLAFDADWRDNRHVAKPLGDCAWTLNDLGYHLQFEFWQPRLGKGVDEVLANGHEPERRHWTQALAASARGQARLISEVKQYA